MNVKKLPRVGVSILSLLPFSFGPGGLRRAWEIAHEAGLDGLQLMPFEWLDAAELATLPKKAVISYEGAWRAPKGFETYYKTTLINRCKGLIVNQLLFGHRTRTQHRLALMRRLFPRAIAVDVGPTDPIEVSPNHRHIKQDDYGHHPGGVVIDTQHLREWEGDITKAPPHLMLTLFLRRKLIRLIHVQTRDLDEFNFFLIGMRTPMRDLARRALESGADVIIELPPWFFECNRRRMVHMLRNVKKRILELVP